MTSQWHAAWCDSDENLSETLLVFPLTALTQIHQTLTEQDQLIHSVHLITCMYYTCSVLFFIIRLMLHPWRHSFSCIASNPFNLFSMRAFRAYPCMQATRGQSYHFTIFLWGGNANYCDSIHLTVYHVWLNQWSCVSKWLQSKLHDSDFLYCSYCQPISCAEPNQQLIDPACLHPKPDISVIFITNHWSVDMHPQIDTIASLFNVLRAPASIHHSSSPSVCGDPDLWAEAACAKRGATETSLHHLGRVRVVIFVGFSVELSF